MKQENNLRVSANPIVSSLLAQYLKNQNDVLVDGYDQVNRNQIDYIGSERA